jgi:hypothetical protein
MSRIRRAWGILMYQAHEFVERAQSELHSEFVGHIEAALRDQVEAEVRERVRSQAEMETVRRIAGYLRNAPSQTKDGYARMIERGRWKDYPKWDFAKTSDEVEAEN